MQCHRGDSKEIQQPITLAERALPPLSMRESRGNSELCQPRKPRVGSPADISTSPSENIQKVEGIEDQRQPNRESLHRYPIASTSPRSHRSKPDDVELSTPKIPTRAEKHARRHGLLVLPGVPSKIPTIVEQDEQNANFPAQRASIASASPPESTQHNGSIYRYTAPFTLFSNFSSRSSSRRSSLQGGKRSNSEIIRRRISDLINGPWYYLAPSLSGSTRSLSGNLRSTTVTQDADVELGLDMEDDTLDELLYPLSDAFPRLAGPRDYYRTLWKLAMNSADELEMVALLVEGAVDPAAVSARDRALLWAMKKAADTDGRDLSGFRAGSDARKGVLAFWTLDGTLKDKPLDVHWKQYIAWLKDHQMKRATTGRASSYPSSDLSLATQSRRRSKPILLDFRPVQDFLSANPTIQRLLEQRNVSIWCLRMIDINNLACKETEEERSAYLDSIYPHLAHHSRATPNVRSNLLLESSRTSVPPRGPRLSNPLATPTVRAELSTSALLPIFDAHVPAAPTAAYIARQTRVEEPIMDVNASPSSKNGSSIHSQKSPRESSKTRRHHYEVANAGGWKEMGLGYKSRVLQNELRFRHVMKARQWSRRVKWAVGLATVAGVLAVIIFVFFFMVRSMNRKNNVESR